MSHLGCTTDCGSWHPKHAHSPRQLALESGIHLLCAKNSIALRLKILCAKNVCTVIYVLNTF